MRGSESFIALSVVTFVGSGGSARGQHDGGIAFKAWPFLHFFFQK